MKRKLKAEDLKLDLSNIPPRKLFNKKWIILEKLLPRGASHCYLVCDKKIEIFGILYLETKTEEIAYLENSIDFLLKQFTIGNSHRFVTIIDSGYFEDQLTYMVTLEKEGPSLFQLLDCLKKNNQTFLSPQTASFLAIDILQVIEILISTGHTIRVFDLNQWKFDVKSRMFYLADPTDIGIITDKRYSHIIGKNIKHIKGTNVGWNGFNKYAPIQYFSDKSNHRMSELDMIETLVYLLFDLTCSSVPWNEDSINILERKRLFLENIESSTLHLKSFGKVLTQMSEIVLNRKNIIEKYEKLPVRNGAWCPNGDRASSLITTVNYDSIVNNFKNIICNNEKNHKLWREMILDWETEITHTPETFNRVFMMQKNDFLKKKVESARISNAKQIHYQIINEHFHIEEKLNKTIVEKYVNGSGQNKTN